MAASNSPPFVVQRGFHLPAPAAAPTANSDTAAVAAMARLLSPEQQAQFYQQQLAQMYAQSQSQSQSQLHQDHNLSMAIPHFSSWPSPGSSDDLTEALHSFINLDGHPSPPAQSLSSSVSTVTNNHDASTSTSAARSQSSLATLPAASSPGVSGDPAPPAAGTAAPSSMPIASKPWTSAADRFHYQHANPHSLGSTVASSSSSSSASTFATTLPSQSYNGQGATAAGGAGGTGSFFGGTSSDTGVKSIFNFHGYNPMPGQPQPQSPPFLLQQLPMQQQIPTNYLASQLPYSLQAQWLQFQSQSSSPLNLPVSNPISPQTSVSPMPPQSPLSASGSRPDSRQNVSRDIAPDRAAAHTQAMPNTNGGSLSHHSHNRSFSSAFSQAALHSPGWAAPSPALSTVSSAAMAQQPPAVPSPSVNPEDLTRTVQSGQPEAPVPVATVAKRNTSRGRSSVVKSPTEDTSRGRTPSTGRAPVQRPSRSKTRRPSYSRTISPHATKDASHTGQQGSERGRPGAESGLRQSVSSGSVGASGGNGSQDAGNAANTAIGGGPPTRQMSNNLDTLSRSVSSSSGMPYMPGYPGAASSHSINIGNAKGGSTMGYAQGPPSSMQRYGASVPTYMEGSGSWQGGSFSTSDAMRSPQLGGRSDFGNARAEGPRSPSLVTAVPPSLQRRQSDTFGSAAHQTRSGNASKDDSPMSRNIPLPNLGDFGDRVAIESPKSVHKDEVPTAAPAKRGKPAKDADAIIPAKNANAGSTLAVGQTISPTEDREMGSPGHESDRDGDDMNEDDDKIGKGGRTVEDRRKKRRESHNAVERRRRDNINDRIMELARLIPEVLLDPATAAAAASASSGSKRPKDRNAGAPALAHGLAGSPPLPTSVATFTPAQLAQQQASNKPNKGIILTKSVEYIEYLHQIVQISSRRNRELEERVQRLEQEQAQMAAAAASVESGPQRHDMSNSPYATYHQHLSEQQQHKSSGSSASASGSASTSGGHRSSASASASPNSLLGSHCGGQPLATVEERMQEEGNGSDRNETGFTYEELLGYANASPAKIEEDEHDHEMAI